MFGIILTLLSIVAVSYLIVKKFYPALSLLLVGLVTLCIAGLVTGDPLVTGKKATHLFAFDVVQVFTNLLQTRTAGLGINIMVIGGFSYYMDRIGATRKLVDICVKPLSYVHAPYVVLGFGYVLGTFLNIFVPSAVGLAVLLMVTLYPLLVSAGVSRYSAAATIALTGCMGLGPSTGNIIFAADISKLHVMEQFINYQLPYALVLIPILAVVQVLLQRWFDRKDLASGKITKDDFVFVEAASKDAVMAPNWYSILPCLPVILLFVFSPLMYKGIRLEIVTALLVSILFAFCCDLIRRRNPKESFIAMKSFFEGMGKLFTSTVTLIICAEVFAAGLTKSGGIATMISYVSTMDAGIIAVFTVMFLIIVLASIVTGSGNAPFFSFAPMIPGITKTVGGDVPALLAPMQLSAGMGRTMSPVAGCIMAIAGMSNISPFDLVRRTIPVMALAIAITYIQALLTI